MCIETTGPAVTVARLSKAARMAAHSQSTMSIWGAQPKDAGL
jgi:hypothetical protein